MKYSLMMCIGALLVAVCVFSTPAWAEPEQGACIFGTQNVWISPGIVVESSLGSNNYVEVGAYSVIMGDITSGGNASLLDYAIVDDDAVVAGSLYKANGADVLGEEEEGASVPPVVIPTKTVSFGGTNVTVDTQHGCDQIVSPGTYNDITVATGCRLTMESGIYHMRKLYLDTYTELLVEGEVEINTARAFNFGDWSIITGVEDPADLIIYTNQNWQVRIGTDTLFSGYLYTPKTVANVAPRASFNGCIQARDVLIDPDAIFIGDEEELPSPMNGRSSRPLRTQNSSIWKNVSVAESSPPPIGATW